MAIESCGKCVFLTACTKKFLGFAMHTLGTSESIKRVRCWRGNWPNLYSFAKARILNCVPCLCKRQTFKTGQHSMHREPLSYINQSIYADEVGLYSPGVKFRGETIRYWISMEDGFSRYPVTGPIKDLSVKTVAEAIVELLINVFSVPEKIHTDRGACFTAMVFQEVMKLGITHTVTPPYSPEGNRVERIHSVIQSCMRSDDRFQLRRLGVFRHIASQNVHHFMKSLGVIPVYQRM